MGDKLMYCKPNVVIEPLVDSWYAWSHLISPATCAMNVVRRHMEIIESYLSNPEAHAQSVLNAQMRGGPFMDFQGGRIEEVEALKAQTLDKRRNLFAFEKMVRELNALLQQAPKGYSLEALYEQVPDGLKGYVELYYDLHNNPNFRFFESLLYRSPYYDQSAQSIALWITNNDHRPFCLSTPRLAEEDVLQLNIPFSSPAIDMLAKMKRTPQPVAAVKEALGILPEQEALFNSFFTEEAPPAYRKYTGDKIRMRYFGHACILIETKEVSILLDPVISYYGYASEIEHFSDIDLPEEIDYVLITHNHQDHILFETLLPLRHKIKKLIVPRTRGGRLEDPDLKLMFEQVGFNNVVELDEMRSCYFEDMTITGLPFTGEHCDLNILTKLCYHVKIGQFSLLFMADSRIIESRLYQHVFKEIGEVDVIFLGMECDGAPLSWLYGPLMPKKLPRDQDFSRRLAGSDYQKGIALVDIFQPGEIYVYAMGQEPWLEFISSIRYTDESNPIVQSNKLIRECTDRGMVAERLFGEKEILYDKGPQPQQEKSGTLSNSMIS